MPAGTENVSRPIPRFTSLKSPSMRKISAPSSAAMTSNVTRFGSDMNFASIARHLEHDRITFAGDLQHVEAAFQRERRTGRQGFFAQNRKVLRMHGRFLPLSR